MYRTCRIKGSPVETAVVFWLRPTGVEVDVGVITPWKSVPARNLHNQLPRDTIFCIAHHVHCIPLVGMGKEKRTEIGPC